MKQKKQAITLICVAALAFSNAHGAELTASDAELYDYLGYSVSADGTIGLAGTHVKTNARGAVYVYRNLDTKESGTEDLKLTGSNLPASSYFGRAVSIEGTTALISVHGYLLNSGAIFVYKNLDTRDSGIEDSMLIASDGQKNDMLAWSVAITNDIAVAGAYGASSSKGAVYVYRNLDSRTGTTSEDLKLTASDTANGDQFGKALDAGNNMALIGAEGKSSNTGAAYLYRNLDTRTSAAQDIKLAASDAATANYFGSAISVDGNIGLVGAYGNESNKGAAYVYRDLETRTATTEDLKLTASDGKSGDKFGQSVGVANGVAIIGAQGANDGKGAAYLYLNLEGRTSTTEDIKITASNAENNDMFGWSSDIGGDNFIIGAYYKNSPGAWSGAAYSGSVNSLTTLDDGTSRTISAISFETRLDWIVGENNDGNSVTLGAGDTATLSDNGKAVYVGKNAVSNGNTLILEGTLNANSIIVGATGNTNNQLYIASTGDLNVNDIYLNIGSSIFFEDEDDFFTAFGSVELLVLENDTWTIVSSANYDDLIDSGVLKLVFANGGMLVLYGCIPEPAEVAAFFGLLALGLASYRKSRTAAAKK